MISVDDVDAIFDRAVQAGASVDDEPADQFHGARQANVVDPFGISWSFISRNTLPRPEVAVRWNALHPTRDGSVLRPTAAREAADRTNSQIGNWRTPASLTSGLIDTGLSLCKTGPGRE
jgi:hypothetical protein